MATVVVGWSGTYASIDEVTRDDSDYLQSHALPLEGTTTATYEVRLTSLTDPTSSIEHIMNYTYKKSGTDGVTIDFQIDLVENTTIRATRTHSDIGATWVEANETLTVTETNSITDYTNLRYRFTFTSSGSGSARSGMISWANLQIPT